MTTTLPFDLTGHGGELRREIRERYATLSRRADVDVLGVPASADLTTIRAAFRDLARRFHPDSVRATSDDARQEANAVFARITEAYHRLSGACSPAPPVSRSREGARPDRSATARVPTRPAANAEKPPTATGPVPSRERPGVSSHDCVEAVLAEANALLALKDTERAIVVLHDVLTLADHAQSRRVQLLLARAYVEAPQWKRYGVRLLQEMVQKDPSDVEALTALGTLYLKEGLLARADATLVRAMKADPSRAETRRQLSAVRSRLDSQDAPEPESRPRRRLAVRLFSRKA